MFALIFLSLILNNCKKDLESISGYTDADSTNYHPPYVRKPNIYIYPTDTIQLYIKIQFPNGGKLINSAPSYEDGWEIEVMPSGLIDNQYQYLFYEAQIPHLLQKEFGWIVTGTDLGSFFKNNLKSLLFSKKEIDDFIEYWIPLLDKTKTYSIYPSFNEDLESVMQLNFSIEPDNLIRVIYIIEECQENKSIEPPQLPLFKREGFVVLEWGVIN